MHSIRACERGLALAPFLISAVTLAAVLSTLASRVLRETERLDHEISAIEGSWHARGEMELARFQIDRSDYIDGENAILRAAVDNTEPIPGTGVWVEETEVPHWFLLTSAVDRASAQPHARCYLRDSTSYAAYNYYVEDHGLGISGSPTGWIHSNRSVQFYFADGWYQDYVSAGEGFDFLRGATRENTQLNGGTDSTAERKALLGKFDLGALAADATWSAPAQVDAHVVFEGDQVRFDLWEKDHWETVPTTLYRRIEGAPVWQEVTRTTYTTERQLVPVTYSRQVWQEYTDGSTSGTGTDVGGGGGGYWVTETWTEMEWRDVRVATGTTTEWEWVPTYTYEPYEGTREVWVRGEFLETVMQPADGIFHIDGTVRSVKGNLNGRVTLLVNEKAEISDSLRYVDEDGDTFYLGGDSADSEYRQNPEFDRDGHALGILCRGDLLYSRSCPEHLEINASLISLEGRVGFEGIRIHDDGRAEVSGSPTLKGSLRRAGSIMSRYCVMSTLLGPSGVLTGFTSGSSDFDLDLRMNPPPGYPFEERPFYLPLIVDPGTGYTAAAAGESSATPLNDGASLDQIRELTRGMHFSWSLPEPPTQ